MRPSSAQAQPPVAGDPAPAPEAGLTDRAVVVLLLGWMLIVFLLPWNPWWVPTGDSEVFLVVARHLQNGDGLVFNGEPVAFIPPGWPLVLAGLYGTTTTYLWLKLVLIGSMITFLLVSYAILRHFTTPATAGLAIGISAVLTPLYPLTFWLHSDSFYCAVAALTGLAAVRWGDGRLGRSDEGWRWWGRWGWGGILLLAMGCAASVFVRWAALVQVFLLAGLVCGSGVRSETGATEGRSPWWPHLAPRHWLGILVIFGISFGTYFTLRTVLGEAGDERVASGGPGAWSILATAEVPQPFAGLKEEGEVPDLFHGTRDDLVTVPRMLFNRLISLPQWLSWTLFQPLRVSGGFGIVGRTLDLGTGLLAFAMLGVAAWHANRRRSYLWLAVLVYVVAIGMNWPLVNNRYLVPIAPFLVCGILVGLGHLAALPRPRVSRVFRGLRWSFVVAALTINGALWAVDVWVFRARSAEDFYARYEAGIHQSLIDVATYLRKRPDVEDGDIAASLRYVNLERRWEYKTSPRVVILFTGRIVRNVPKDLTGSGVKKAQAWARETHTRFYVQQNPTMPGRFWHFRLTPELHERITGYPPHPERPQFELFAMLPDPIPANPSLHSLLYLPVPPVEGEELERMTRSVPTVP